MFLLQEIQGIRIVDQEPSLATELRVRPGGRRLEGRRLRLRGGRNVQLFLGPEVQGRRAGVRLRTNSTKRLRSRENALYLVFKVVLRLSTNWRPINGRNQLALLLDGESFDDGRLRRTPASNMEGTAA
ncbi:MAG: hypothetical protein B7Z74_06635 [Deltaproteobacteria bacterium 21-66-5]|nr:MAG: hypothetical protein B7Z74_06635 [Deltaproteobacteria bacterium 21-66-5]